MNDLNVQLENEVTRSLGLRESRRSGMARKALWSAGALVAVAAIAALTWNGIQRGDGVQYRTQPVQRGSLTITVTATGSLVPTKQVDVGIEVSGTVKAVEVDFNDRVKLGDVLARLDTTKLEAQVLQTSAALESARAKLAQSRATVQESSRQLARLEQLHELTGGEAPSRQDLDAGRATLERSRADEAAGVAAVSQTQAVLDANRTDLSKAVIHSPINGVVLKRSVDPGQTVAASFQSPVLFTLAEDLRQMQLQVDVDEADVGKVREGQSASFTVDAFPDRAFPARIVQVRYGSQNVANVVTYKAVLNVDNSSLVLRPGMTATAIITVKNIADALLVPNAALRFSPPAQESAAPQEGGSLLSKIMPLPPRRTPPRENANARQQRVWVVREGQLQAIPVTLGDSNGVLTQISAGAIEPGMALVTDRIAAAR